MLEGIRLTPEEIIKAEGKAMLATEGIDPIQETFVTIANAATDKAIKKIVADIEEIIIYPQNRAYRIAAIDNYLEALKSMIKE